MISFKMDGIEYRAYDHLFAASQCGKVLRAYKPYNPRNYRKDGYLTLGRRGLMHRIIAKCWTDNPDNKKHVHHINENKKDNRACNLQWVDQTEHNKEFHKVTSSYVRTKETLERFRDAQLGKKDTEETRAKKSAAMRLFRSTVPVGTKTQCKYKGVIYDSLKQACLEAVVSRNCFVKRCRSKNFPDYELI